MTIYTVHEPAGLTGRRFEDAARLVFVRDGFCWPALVIPVLWLLYRRMWLILLVYIVVAIVFEWVARVYGEPLILSLTGLAFALLFALVANDLRRWHLSRKGYRMRAVTGGRDLEECERKFFSEWLAETPAPTHIPAQGNEASAAARLPDTGPGVIGVFPEPGGR